VTIRRDLVREHAALNKTETLLWEDWDVLDSRIPPRLGELLVLDELAALTGQPRPDRCPGGRRRQRGGPGSQLTGASARLAVARPVAALNG